MTLNVNTRGGEISISELSFALNEKDLPSGSYEIVINDVTKGITETKLLKPMRIDLKIFDSEVEAEIAANSAPVKGGKKK